MSIDDRLVLGKTLREHVGGRWAISWQMYVINIPINAAGMSASITDAGNVNPGRWILVWFLSYLAFGLVLLVANALTYRRREAPMPIWVVSAIGAAAGLVRAVTADVTAFSLGLTGLSPTTMVSGILTGSVLGAILVPAAALLFSLITTFTSRRQAFVDERVQLMLQIIREEGEAERLRQSVLLEVENKLAQAVSRDDIRSARDLSHYMWREAEQVATPRISIGGVIRRTITSYPYPASAVSAIWFVSAVGTLITTIGLLRGLLQATVTAITIILTFIVAKKLTVRFSHASAVILAVTLAVLVIVTGPVASWIFDPRPLGSGVTLVLANSVWLPALALTVGLVITAVRSSEEILDQLADEIQEDEILVGVAARERVRVQREVAETIHRLQSRVLVARTSDDERIPLTVSELLVDPLAGQSGEEQLRTILRKWGTLMSVSLGDISSDLTPNEASATRRIVDEACANAFRHGSARSVGVEVARVSTGLRVIVTDDGNGPAEGTRSGLGSALFDSLAPGGWSMVRTHDERTVLTVELRDSQT